MNTPRIFLFLLLTAGSARAQAQDNATPRAATEPAPTEMQKWIATTDAQWQAAFKRDVTDVYDTEIGTVRLQYLTSLETAISKASGASDLDGALALRNELKRFSDTKVFPEQDDAADASSVKKIRAAIRAQFARVEKERARRAKSLHAKYDQVLAQAQAQLTQRQRLDEALLVKNKREEIAATWLAGIAATPAPEAPTTGRQLEKKLAKTTWNYSVKLNDPSPSTTVTIHDDGTVSWSDRPALHVAYKALDELTIQVRDHVWKFSRDLQSFTIHEDRNAPAIRFGTRINATK